MKVILLQWITYSPVSTYFLYCTSRVIGATGTVRENRLREVSFSNKKTFAKLERGTTEACATEELLLVRWNDNRLVTVLTNQVDLNASKSCKRWSASQKKHLVIRMPGPIATYNQNMGGIDLSDQMVAMVAQRNGGHCLHGL